MTVRLTARSTLVGIAAALLLAPDPALAQVLVGETSARFDWMPASGDVHFYQVFVSRSSRGGSYEVEQTVTSNSVTLDAGVGEVVRVRVRAGNDDAFGPLSLPSDPVRFGLPPELPVLGTPGVFQGRAGGSDTPFIFYANPETGDVFRFSAIDASAPATRIGHEPDPYWTLFASGDFDGDGVADLFWRHVSGATRIWFVDESSYEEELGPTYPGARWIAELTADFDQNGQDDVLWRQPGGAIQAWFRVGTEFETTAFPPMPQDTFELLSAGDFDGDDGFDDIFWRNVTNTDTLIWFMALDPQNGSYARMRVSSKRTLLWEVQETRDENGDGTDDLRWRMKNSHEITEWWLMDGELVTPR
jgi:hypothetical protein